MTFYENSFMKFNAHENHPYPSSSR